jgi:hypothetical protein
MEKLASRHLVEMLVKIATMSDIKVEDMTCRPIPPLLGRSVQVNVILTGQLEERAIQAFIASFNLSILSSHSATSSR